MNSVQPPRASVAGPETAEQTQRVLECCSVQHHITDGPAKGGQPWGRWGTKVLDLRHKITDLSALLLILCSETRKLCEVIINLKQANLCGF